MSKERSDKSSFRGNPNIIPFVPAHQGSGRTILLAVVLVLVSAAAASGMRLDAARGESAAAPRAAESAIAGAEFVYFPGQYVNRATESSEHIAAF